MMSFRRTSNDTSVNRPSRSPVTLVIIQPSTMERAGCASEAVFEVFGGDYELGFLAGMAEVFEAIFSRSWSTFPLVDSLLEGAGRLDFAFEKFERSHGTAGAGRTGFAEVVAVGLKNSIHEVFAAYDQAIDEMPDGLADGFCHREILVAEFWAEFGKIGLEFLN